MRPATAQPRSGRLPLVNAERRPAIGLRRKLKRYCAFTFEDCGTRFYSPDTLNSGLATISTC